MPENNLTETTIDTVLVVGAGIMGHGFAQLLAMNKLNVYLVDQTDDYLDRARGWIQDNLDFMIELAELQASEKAATLSRINFTTNLAENLPQADFILEAVSENFELKRKVWKIMGQKAAPGFVANRIQFALAAEAIALVEEGLATPEEVDRIVKSSFGFRLGAYGPFEIMDQAGADTYLGVYQYLEGKLGKTCFKPPQLLKKQVESGRLGLKSSRGFYDYGHGAADAVRRERDRKFYARLQLVRQEWGQEE